MHIGKIDQLSQSYAVDHSSISYAYIDKTFCNFSPQNVHLLQHVFHLRIMYAVINVKYNKTINVAFLTSFITLLTLIFS